MELYTKRLSNSYLHTHNTPYTFIEATVSKHNHGNLIERMGLFTPRYK